jgi:hypothetical protein
MEKDYLFLVHTTKAFVDEEHTNIPEGSGIYVEKELKNDYKGIWSSCFGSFHVKVPKDICRKLDENAKQENYAELMRRVDPEGCKRLDALLAEAESRMY